MRSRASSSRSLESGGREIATSQEAYRGLRVPLLKSVVDCPTADGQVIRAVRKRPHDAARGAVVLFHGFGQNRYTFHLPGLSLTAYLVHRGYDTYNVDLRGHGLSRPCSRPPRSADEYFRYDFPAVVSLANSLSGRPVFAIGHSLGGAVVYAGSTFVPPHALAGLIPIAPVFAFGGRQPLFHLAGRLLQLIPPTFPLLTLPLPAYVAGGALLAAAPLVDHPWTALSPVHFWYPRTMDERLLLRRLALGFDRVSIGVTRHLLTMAVDGFVSADRSMDYAARFSQMVDVPLFVIGGDHDVLLPPSDAKAGYRAARTKDKTLRIFGPQDGGRSWGHIDIVQGERAPKFVWPEIANWMDQHTPHSN